MIRTVSLALWLFAFWLLLSGHYTLWLVGAGLIVSAGIALIGHFSGFADEEGHPVERLVGGVTYWPWLAVEIVKSSLDVARAILDPRRTIEPTLFEIEVGPKTAVGAATYANSITLTPGTVTVGIDRERDRFTVHALTKAGADGLRGGEMDRRVVAFERTKRA